MAQHVDVIMDMLTNFIDIQLTSVAKGNPIMALVKPLITRVIDNNSYKVETLLKQIADKDGLVDAKGILSEMIDNITSMNPTKLDTGFLGELEIGGGKIKMNIPLLNKALVLTHQDLIDFRNLFV